MSEIRFTRAQRRQMQKLADKIDRITQAVRRFFERFPHRQHRIRLAGQAEIEQQTLLPPWVPQGYHLFAIIRNVSPGYRRRLFAPGPPSVDTDAPEDLVRGVWEAAATPKVWEIEAQTRKMAGNLA